MGPMQQSTRTSTAPQFCRRRFAPGARSHAHDIVAVGTLVIFTPALISACLLWSFCENLQTALGGSRPGGVA